MSDWFTSPSDQTPLTRARAAAINNLDSAVATAFAAMPTQANLKQGKVTYAVDTGAADAYVVSLPHNPGSYTDGLRVDFKVTNTNTGASTINVNSLGVKTIKRLNGDALGAGDLPANGIVSIFYNTTTGFFHLTTAAPQTAAGVSVSPTGNISSTNVQAALAELDSEKAPAASPTFSGAIYNNGSARGNITAVGALDIDCSQGNYFTKSISTNSTFTVSNVPSSRAYGFTLRLTISSSAVPTWFSGVIWPAGVAPNLANGVHLLMFMTDDGGTTWRSSVLSGYAS